MAPPAAYAIDNMQDVGGMGFEPGKDKHALTLDTVDAPLSVAIEKSGKPVKYWEYQVHALSSLLVGGGKVRPGEMRRAIEFMPVTAFSTKSYYEKWASAIATTMIERGTITQPELDEAMGISTEEPPVLYKPGSYVRCKPEDAAVRYRKPHLRYLYGVVGRIDTPTIGYLEEPDIDAFHYVEGPRQPVYRVVFYQKDLWEGYNGTDDDNLEIEIWQSWLLPSSEKEFKEQQANRIKAPEGFHQRNKGHEHDHEHEHEHGHKHEERTKVEMDAIKAEGDDAEKARLIQCLIKILTAKGVVSAADITGHIEELESYGSRGLGPRVVAKAWTDPEFKKRLLEDGVAGVTELGISAEGWLPKGGVTEPNGQLSGIILKVVENKPGIHHLLVCTLCSCYPISVLGMAPSWYKARSYRARSVRDPRAVLKEFGLELPKETIIQVLDSNADSRFLSIPLRPEGTEGWTEDQLQALVTRDSIVGVGLPKTPEQLKKEGGTFFPKSEGYKGRFIYQ
ncbi:MAG: nitrile hydratase subunit alpha [Trebouxia sp. A1-2]|nr:MAG: nitrile hydratase subunit alpha [Trebouxia sp. A1-2]